jgi:hypothetical protein
MSGTSCHKYIDEDMEKSTLRPTTRGTTTEGTPRVKLDHLRQTKAMTALLHH